MSTATTEEKAPKKRQKRGGGRKGVRTYPQRDRAVELFKKQLVEGTTHSIEEILLEAGYTPEAARQQSNVMAGIRPLLDPFIERMKKLRERAIERAEKTVEQAMFPDAITAADKLTKNIQLLSGKPTGVLSLSDEDRDRIEDLLG